MSIDIQYCMRDNRDNEKVYFTCPTIGCDGVLYYPEVEEDDIGSQMDAFYAFCRCTGCEEYTDRDNTAPRYLTRRIVVRR